MVVVFGVLDRPSCERQGAPFSQNQFRTTVNPSTSPDPVRLPTYSELVVQICSPDLKRPALNCAR